MLKELLPLGDQAALAYFDSEPAALWFAAEVRRAGHPWVVDIVSAYTTVAVFFDLETTSFAAVAGALAALAATAPVATPTAGGRLHRIPCCYELQLDMRRVEQRTGLRVHEIIRLHTETEYTIYAIGFCPGFPYLGYLPDALCGVPRLETPRLRVEAGSVGLTGRQTGIYPLPRPGGWNLLGRTPLELVNVADGYFPLRAGDRVRFERIDEREFAHLLGERLPTGS
jgi:inhibitor of KinA